MANAHLTTYLNDHLAGAGAALALLANLSSAYPDGDVPAFARAMHDDVAADRETLRQIMRQLGVAESRSRQAAAWAGEKLAELKVRADDPAKRGLHRFELFEALSLGIEGKRLLWLSLAEVAAAEPDVRIADYDALRTRAEAQRAEVERRRLAAARLALLG